MIANDPNGISSWELHRALGVIQKSAWFMLHRIRLARQDNLTSGTLGGEVEIDESFIGGKIRNMHKAKKVRVQKESQKGEKAVVLGILERASEKNQKRVRATVIRDRKKDTMQAEVAGMVAPGTRVYSDEFASRWRMDDPFEHSVVDHLSQYVDGQVHTNCMGAYSKNRWGGGARSSLPAGFRPRWGDAVHAGVGDELAHMLVVVNDDAEIHAIHGGVSGANLDGALEIIRLQRGVGGLDGFERTL